MRICFFPGDYSGAGCYRCLFPCNELKYQFGHDAFLAKGIHQGGGVYGYDMKTIPNADLYVLQQRPEAAWLKIVPFLKDRGKIVVCETDDYHLGVPHWHPAYVPLKVHGFHQTLPKIYAMADAMTVSTPFLKEAYSKYNENIHLLPNYWDKTMWEQLPKKNWQRTRIGWMGISAMRPADINVLKGVIGPFLRRHPEVDFVAAGDPSVHDQLDVPEGQRVSYPRCEFGLTPQITATMDVGLVPLADAPFNEAKSYLKGLEYAICGIPCIASPSQQYREWVDEGENGYLARRGHDWIRVLERLVDDPEHRRRLGRAARAKAERFTIQDHAGKWDALYRSLVGDRYDQIARDAIMKAALQKPSELAPFLRYVAERKPKVVVEIGTAQGGMLYALARAVHPEALIVSIDLPGGDRDETSADDKYGQRDVEKMASYALPGQAIEFIEADSQHVSTRATLSRILQGRGIDLLFIDGDHSYEGVKADWELWRGLVSGVVAFHDIISHEKQEVEVDRLWAEIKRDYEVTEFRSPEDFGWGPWGGIGVIDMSAQEVAA